MRVGILLLAAVCVLAASPLAAAQAAPGPGAQPPPLKVAFDPAPIPIAPGGTASAWIVVTNPTAGREGGTLRVSPEPGWTVDPFATPVDLQPGATARYLVRITAPERIAPETQLRAGIERSDGYFLGGILLVVKAMPPVDGTNAPTEGAGATDPVATDAAGGEAPPRIEVSPEALAAGGGLAAIAAIGAVVYKLRDSTELIGFFKENVGRMFRARKGKDEHDG